MGWWFTLIGAILILIGGGFTVAGILLSPKDNIYRNIIVQKKLFSDTQYIKSWPELLGGIDELNLDNTGILKAYFPRDKYSITLISNITPVGMSDKNETGKFQATGIKKINMTNKTDEILFDLEHPIHEFKFQDRVFSVKLLGINEKNIEGVKNAIEYKFGISEID